MRVLQVNTADWGGGAEKVAWELFRSYRNAGIESWLVVGRKRSTDENVIQLHNGQSGFFSRACFKAATMLRPLEGRVRGASRLSALIRVLPDIKHRFNDRLGLEDFSYSSTHKLLSLVPHPVDVVHCHNLHGWYFDLRYLAKLSRQLPVFLTLHDAWLLSGHCAHSFDCERWRAGCGNCPDLTIYPAIKRDATRYNWRRKQRIYSRSRLYIATPCRWLMEKVEKSILAKASVEARVIPYGVDLSIFRYRNKHEAKRILGISPTVEMLLFAANGIKQNIWKDYRTMSEAIAKVAPRLRDRKLVFIALGDNSPPERVGETEVRFVPHQRDPSVVALYYQAADVYLHAARADTFPNAILEALACGTPVVATAVGGIPEQVTDGTDGFLTPVGDSEAMASKICCLLSNSELRLNMGENAAKKARQYFDLDRQVGDYISWYRNVIEQRSPVRLF